MRILANIANTDVPDSDYPKGKIRNKNEVSGVPGSPVVEEIYGDIIQFFLKLVEDTNITENDLPDNVSNGHQLVEALKKFVTRGALTEWENLAITPSYSAFTVSGAGAQMSVCRLTNSRFAFLDSGNMRLRAYERFGNTWNVVGTGLLLTGITTFDIAFLDTNVIVLSDIGNGQIVTYTFNGSTWSQTGNALSLTINNAAVCKIDTNTIAIIIQNELRTYSWNGTNWSQVGSGLVIAGISSPSLSQLGDNLVALANSNNHSLAKYSWDGVNWSIVGNSATFPTAAGLDSVYAIGENQVISYHTGIALYLNYKFDGTDWNEVGIRYYEVPGGNHSRMLRMDNGLIIRANAGGGNLQHVIRIPVI